MCVLACAADERNEKVIASNQSRVLSIGHWITMNKKKTKKTKLQRDSCKNTFTFTCALWKKSALAQNYCKKRQMKKTEMLKATAQQQQQQPKSKWNECEQSLNGIAIKVNCVWLFRFLFFAAITYSIDVDRHIASLLHRAFCTHFLLFEYNFYFWFHVPIISIWWTRLNYFVVVTMKRALRFDASENWLALFTN